MQNLLGYLEKKTEQVPDLDVEQEEKTKLLYVVKLAAYIMSSHLCIIEDQIADNNSMENVGRVIICNFRQFKYISRSE